MKTFNTDVSGEGFEFAQEDPSCLIIIQGFSCGVQGVQGAQVDSLLNTRFLMLIW